MRIIAFAWTTPALLAGQKTVTRRDWYDRFTHSIKPNEYFQAWDHGPRVRGAHRVATIRLMGRPYKESTGLAPDEDWYAEGFDYLQENGLLVDGLEPIVLWRVWHLEPKMMWVVRFELMELMEVASCLG